MEVAEVVTDEVETVLSTSTVKGAIHLYPARYEILRKRVLADDDPKVAGNSPDRVSKSRLTCACRAIQDYYATRPSQLRHARRLPCLE
jgi:hypothetical protein